MLYSTEKGRPMSQATAIILAGGKSSRMGTDKALIKVNNDNMLESAVRALAGGFSELVVSANNKSYDSLEIRTVSDVFPGRGPLAGIHACLLASGNDVNFVVPCDMPFIDVKLALYMVELAAGFDVVVPKIGNYYEPLFAVYNKSCLPAIEAHLMAGQNKVTMLFSEGKLRVRNVNKEEIEKFGHSESLFFNVNTPVDLEKAKNLAGRKMMDRRYEIVEALRIKDGESKPVEDPVTRETPLTVYLNDQELVTLLSTMEYWDELAVGFLYSEGFLKSREDITEIKSDPELGSVQVKSKRTAAVAKETFLKRYITTGCGKGSTFYHLSDAVCQPVSDGFRVKAEQIFNLMNQAQRMSELFKETGGVHSSALCTSEKILFFREDIGRHNTVDKLAGRCLLDNIPLDDKILITTGRISSEILIKTAKMGIPVIASRSAPTDLAVKHAQDLGITIAAFVRNQRMNVYSYPDRVIP